MKRFVLKLPIIYNRQKINKTGFAFGTILQKICFFVKSNIK